MNKNLLSIGISTLLLFVLAFSAYKTYSFSAKYNAHLHEHAQSFKIENKMDSYLNISSKDTWKKITEYFSDTKEMVKESELEKHIKEASKEMYFYATAFFISLFLLLLTYFISSKSIFVFFVVSASLVSWVVGVLAPIMSIEVFKDLPLFGYTIFKYDFKSIWGSVEKLWLVNNYIVAVLVALFSMIIPILKSLAIYFSIATKKDLKYMDYIGKWSMADVFVVALLITNLSLNADEFTDAKVQIAIYFFSSYVILALIASSLTKVIYQQKLH